MGFRIFPIFLFFFLSRSAAFSAIAPVKSSSLERVEAEKRLDAETGAQGLFHRRQSHHFPQSITDAVIKDDAGLPPLPKRA
mmetsp:Transcript_18818/g.33602  ORF Transcript_18818/g.33602 Transcript_18818/m.33602 type:complete len:81 (-) Transcript_18818:1174-1416(-)